MNNKLNDRAPHSRKDYPFIERKHRDVLEDIFNILAVATSAEIDESQHWPEQSQLYIQVDKDWYLNPVKWLQETAIIIGDINEVSRAWIRYWSLIDKASASDKIDMEKYSSGQLWCGEILGQLVDACGRLMFSMERFRHTAMPLLHRQYKTGEIGVYNFILPEPLYLIDELSNNKVDRLLEKVGTLYCRHIEFLIRSLYTINAGTSRIVKTVSEIRHLTNKRNDKQLLLYIWQCFFDLYCWAANVAPAALVLCDEWDSILIDKFDLLEPTG